MIAAAVLEESTPRADDRPRPPIVVRNPKFAFDEVPKYWVLGNGALTHISNGLNLLFPMGERFFVRSVRHFESQIRDPKLREEARAFYAQEGRHAGAHERQMSELRKQGLGAAMDHFFQVYQRLGFDFLEKAAPPVLNLAATAALEHFTATLAEGTLSSGELDGLPAEMQRLLGWHSIEELEHKAVAFDVLQEVSGSYAWRIAGLCMAVTTLAGFWVYATHELCKADGISLTEFLAQTRAAKGERSTMRDIFIAGTREYLRRDFHPLDRDTEHLVQDWLKKWNM